MIDNVVLRAGGIGVEVRSPNGSVVGNVVGDCGDDGFRTWSVLEVANNTSYGNGGSGFVVAPSAVERNIAAFNRGFGFRNTYPDYPFPLSCNDWFMNDSGAVYGLPLGATDLEVDPLFCDLARDSVWLRADSPLLDAIGCGRIGARGVGCDDTTPTRTPRDPDPPPAVFDLALFPPVPNPATRGARIRFTLPVAMPVRLSLFDVAGREVAVLARGVRPAGENEAALPASGIHAGVYVARLEAGGRRLTGKVLIVP